MSNEELANKIAQGIVESGVEGGTDNVCCSTAGDYPCMGVSSWEGIGGRGDNLLSYLDGGQKFIGRSYTDIVESDEKEELATLLDSPQGQAAQRMILAGDCLEKYVPALEEVPELTNIQCIVYAGMWCPTSHYVVKRFLTRRSQMQDDNGNQMYNLNNLETLRDLFREQYAIAADIPENCYEGYANRADVTYEWVVNNV